MYNTVENSFDKLRKYCEDEDFYGLDPYYGLNSKIFQAMPIVRNNKFCRSAWIQLFKKLPINFRKLLFMDHLQISFSEIG